MLDDVFFSVRFFGMLLGGVAVWHYFRWYFLFRRRARREVRVIAQAIRDYVEKYDRIPAVDTAHNEQPVDQLMNVLRGYNCFEEGMPPGMADELNPAKIDFLGQLPVTKSANALSSRDPWGRKYHIALCRNLDGKTEIEFEDDQTFANASPIRILHRSTRVVTVTVDSPLAVWSDGPNRRNECGYGDDICSWTLGLPASLRDRSKGRPL
ncbi:MAG: hypothetical protein EXS37_15080 [Opitutus sp.]|nr:hypothetical protein [Opitutus sp.]